MNGETLLAEAIEMKDEIVENRRAIHRAPEVGAHLPQTVQFVEEKLRLLGYEPRELGGGDWEANVEQLKAENAKLAEAGGAQITNLPSSGADDGEGGDGEGEGKGGNT